MSASNHALAWDDIQLAKDVKAQANAAPAPSLASAPAISPVPALRVMPLLRGPQPRRFVRVPTHVVGVHLEQRECPRASLRLPLKLRSVGGVLEEYPVTLVTRDISSSGVFFLSPKALPMEAEIELDIAGQPAPGIRKRGGLFKSACKARGTGEYAGVVRDCRKFR